MAAAEGFDPRAAADAAWSAQRGKPNGAGSGTAMFKLTSAADLVARGADQRLTEPQYPKLEFVKSLDHAPMPPTPSW